MRLWDWVFSTNSSSIETKLVVGTYYRMAVIRLYGKQLLLAPPMNLSSYREKTSRIIFTSNHKKAISEIALDYGVKLASDDLLGVLGSPMVSLGSDVIEDPKER